LLEMLLFTLPPPPLHPQVRMHFYIFCWEEMGVRLLQCIAWRSLAGNWLLNLTLET
jgi:hypothetical protein